MDQSSQVSPFLNQRFSLESIQVLLETKASNVLVVKPPPGRRTSCRRSWLRRHSTRLTIAGVPNERLIKQIKFYLPELVDDMCLQESIETFATWLGVRADRMDLFYEPTESIIHSDLQLRRLVVDWVIRARERSQTRTVQLVSELEHTFRNNANTDDTEVAVHKLWELCCRKQYLDYISEDVLMAFIALATKQGNSAKLKYYCIAVLAHLLHFSGAHARMLVHERVYQRMGDVILDELDTSETTLWQSSATMTPLPEQELLQTETNLETTITLSPHSANGKSTTPVTDYLSGQLLGLLSCLQSLTHTGIDSAAMSPVFVLGWTVRVLLSATVNKLSHLAIQRSLHLASGILFDREYRPPARSKQGAFVAQLALALKDCNADSDELILWMLAQVAGQVKARSLIATTPGLPATIVAKLVDYVRRRSDNDPTVTASSSEALLIVVWALFQEGAMETKTDSGSNSIRAKRQTVMRARKATKLPGVSAKMLSALLHKNMTTFVDTLNDEFHTVRSHACIMTTLANFASYPEIRDAIIRHSVVDRCINLAESSSTRAQVCFTACVTRFLGSIRRYMLAASETHGNNTLTPLAHLPNRRHSTDSKSQSSTKQSRRSNSIALPVVGYQQRREEALNIAFRVLRFTRWCTTQPDERIRQYGGLLLLNGSKLVCSSEDNSAHALKLASLNLSCEIALALLENEAPSCFELYTAAVSLLHVLLDSQVEPTNIAFLMKQWRRFRDLIIDMFDCAFESVCLLVVNSSAINSGFSPDLDELSKKGHCDGTRFCVPVGSSVKATLVCAWRLLEFDSQIDYSMINKNEKLMREAKWDANVYAKAIRSITRKLLSIPSVVVGTNGAHLDAVIVLGLGLVWKFDERAQRLSEVLPQVMSLNANETSESKDESVDSMIDSAKNEIGSDNSKDKHIAKQEKKISVDHRVEGLGFNQSMNDNDVEEDEEEQEEWYSFADQVGLLGESEIWKRLRDIATHQQLSAKTRVRATALYELLTKRREASEETLHQSKKCENDSFLDESNNQGDDEVIVTDDSVLVDDLRYEQLLVTQLGSQLPEIFMFAAMGCARVAMKRRKRELLGKLGAIRAIMRLIKVNMLGSEAMLIGLLEALLNLSSASENQREIVKSGLNALVQVGNGHGSNHIRKLVCGILKNCARNKSNRTSMYKTELTSMTAKFRKEQPSVAPQWMQSRGGRRSINEKMYTTKDVNNNNGGSDVQSQRAKYDKWLNAVEHSVSKPKFGRKRQSLQKLYDDEPTSSTMFDDRYIEQVSDGRTVGNNMGASTLAGRLRRPANESLIGMKGGYLKSTDLISFDPSTSNESSDGRRGELASATWWEPCIKSITFNDPVGAPAAVDEGIIRDQGSMELRLFPNSKMHTGLGVDGGTDNGQQPSEIIDTYAAQEGKTPPVHVVAFKHISGSKFCDGLYRHFQIPNGDTIHLFYKDEWLACESSAEFNSPVCPKLVDALECRGLKSGILTTLNMDESNISSDQNGTNIFENQHSTTADMGGHQHINSPLEGFNCISISIVDEPVPPLVFVTSSAFFAEKFKHHQPSQDKSSNSDTTNTNANAKTQTQTQTKTKTKTSTNTNTKTTRDEEEKAQQDSALAHNLHYPTEGNTILRDESNPNVVTQHTNLSVYDHNWEFGVERLPLLVLEKPKILTMFRRNAVLGSSWNLNESVFKKRGAPGPNTFAGSGLVVEMGYLNADGAMEQSFECDWDRLQNKGGFQKWFRRTFNEVERPCRQGSTVEDDLDEIGIMIQDSYITILNAFRHFVSKSGDPFYLTLNGFGELMSESGVVKSTSAKCKKKDIDNIFIASAVQERTLDENHVNPRNGLIRSEFLEGIIRVAMAKYGNDSEILKQQQMIDTELAKRGSYKYPIGGGGPGVGVGSGGSEGGFSDDGSMKARRSSSFKIRRRQSSVSSIGAMYGNMHGGVNRPPMSSWCMKPSQAVWFLLKNHFDEEDDYDELGSPDPDAFRARRMYNRAVDTVLKHHLPLLRFVFKEFIRSENGKPGKMMSTSDWTSLLHDFDMIDGSYTDRHATLDFITGKLMIPNELMRRSEYKCVGFVDFLELVCRMADNVELKDGYTVVDSQTRQDLQGFGAFDDEHYGLHLAFRLHLVFEYMIDSLCEKKGTSGKKLRPGRYLKELPPPPTTPDDND